MSPLNHIPLLGDAFVKVAIINKQVRICLHRNAALYVDIGVEDLYSFMEWIFTHVAFTKSTFKGNEFTVNCDCTVKIVNHLDGKRISWTELDLVLFVERFAYISAAVQYWQSQIQILQTADVDHYHSVE